MRQGSCTEMVLGLVLLGTHKYIAKCTCVRTRVASSLLHVACFVSCNHFYSRPASCSTQVTKQLYMRPALFLPVSSLTLSGVLKHGHHIKAMMKTCFDRKRNNSNYRAWPEETDNFMCACFQEHHLNPSHAEGAVLNVREILQIATPATART